MKKALPFAIAMLFVCPVLIPTSANANDGGKGTSSPSVLHRNHGKSWIDKAWDDLMNLFKSHHDNGNDKDKGKGPGHHDGPGSGHNGNDGGGNGNNGNHNGWGNNDGSGGYGGGNAGGNGGGSSPSAPLDGGLSLLMIAGVGLGVKKTFGRKKEA
jgi:hypothetical protein